MSSTKFWVATYLNPKTNETNTYLLSDEPLESMDDCLYVERTDHTKVIDPKRYGGVFDAVCFKCVWMHDANKGHDTFRRVWIS